MKIKINSLKIQDILLLKVFIVIIFNSISLSCSSNKKDTRQMNKSKGSEVPSSSKNEKVNDNNPYKNKQQSNNKLIIDTSETNLTPLLISGYVRNNICNTKNYPKEISKLIERYFLTNYDICHINNNQIYIIPISFEDIFKEKGNINSMKFNFPDRGIDKPNSSFILDSLNKKNNYDKNEWKRWKRKKLRIYPDCLGYWAKIIDPSNPSSMELVPSKHLNYLSLLLSKLNYKSDIQIIFLKNKQPCNYSYSNSDVISEYNVKYCKLKNENDKYICALSLEIKKPLHSKFDNNKYLKKNQYFIKMPI